MPSDADNTNFGDDAKSTGGLQPNTVTGTLIVATVLCLVCSLLVSGTAIALRGRIKANKEIIRQRNVLVAAGLYDDAKHTNANVPELFEQVQMVLVNLPARTGSDDEAGRINTSLDPATYDARKASRDENDSVPIPADLDAAGIKRREKVAPVYLINGPDGSPEQLILPINGKGLWSTLYGFIALKADVAASLPVTGITFYEHKETPGLGGEVDNKKWKAQWPGKQLFDADWQPVLDITKPDNAKTPAQVDGMSGATVTSNGVEDLVNYWLGDDAFGPFLERYRNGELNFTAQQETQ